MNFLVKRDDLTSKQVIDLINYHANTLREQTAPGSAHVLDIEQLKGSNIIIWTAWLDDALCGMGGLKVIDEEHAELKSFHTIEQYRGNGIGKKLLNFIIERAREMGISRLVLGTGSWQYFIPAVNLYKSFGFVETGPFDDEKLDPNSRFFELKL